MGFKPITKCGILNHGKQFIKINLNEETNPNLTKLRVMVKINYLDIDYATGTGTKSVCTPASNCNIKIAAQTNLFLCGKDRWSEGVECTISGTNTPPTMWRYIYKSGDFTGSPYDISDMNNILESKNPLGTTLTTANLIDGFEDQIQHGVLGVNYEPDDQFRNNFFTDSRYFSEITMTSTSNYWEYSNSFPILLHNPITSGTSKKYKPDYLYLCLDLPNNNKQFYYQIVCAQHNDSNPTRSTVDTELQKYLDVTQDKLYGGKANSIKHGVNGFEGSVIPPSEYDTYSGVEKGKTNYWGFRTDRPV